MAPAQIPVFYPRNIALRMTNLCRGSGISVVLVALQVLQRSLRPAHHCRICLYQGRARLCDHGESARLSWETQGRGVLLSPAEDSDQKTETTMTWHCYMFKTEVFVGQFHDTHTRACGRDRDSTGILSHSMQFDTLCRFMSLPRLTGIGVYRGLLNPGEWYTRQ